MTGAQGPIGVFDSGVGGLTVVRGLLSRFPKERVLYVADQAHVPYGGRPLEEVRGFACAISAFLAEQGCRAIVMGCNISSAIALRAVSEQCAPLPVLGVIAPAARRAVDLLQDAGEPPRVGVLATEGTVRSAAYSVHLRGLRPDIFVREVACPKFVPLVERGATDSEEAEEAAHEYLAPLADERCSAVILGCTHYPFLLSALRRVARKQFDRPVPFVDPAHEIAGALREALPDAGAHLSGAPHLLLTTGDPEPFRAQIPQFLPGVEGRAGQARWTADSRLVLASSLAPDTNPVVAP